MNLYRAFPQALGRQGKRGRFIAKLCGVMQELFLRIWTQGVWHSFPESPWKIFCVIMGDIAPCI